MLKRKPAIAVAVSVVATVTLGMGLAIATEDKDRSILERTSQPRATVPKAASLRADFTALRRPAMPQVPGEVQRFVATGPTAAAAGTASDKVYSVAAPASAEQRSWYLASGAEALCLYTGVAGVCASRQAAKRGELVQLEVPAPPAAPEVPKDGELPTPPSHTPTSAIVQGLAPDGVWSVVVNTEDGTAVREPVSADGTYRVSVDSPPRSLSLEKQDDTPISVSLR